MSMHAQTGFTVIEVMLFLAITGLLVAGILGGMGMALASQRYKDAVATFQSDIQQQYEDISAVQNNRTAGTDGSCQGARGQSDCVLLGTLLTVGADGQKRVYTVYGSESNAASGADEYAVIRSYTPQATQLDRQDSQMEWGTGVSPPVGQTSNGVGILVVRSPQSGAIHTFTRNGTAANNLSAMVSTAASGRRVMCVTPGGWTVAEPLAMYIGSQSASVGGVEVYSQEMLLGEGLRC